MNRTITLTTENFSFPREGDPSHHHYVKMAILDTKSILEDLTGNHFDTNPSSSPVPQLEPSRDNRIRHQSQRHPSGNPGLHPHSNNGASRGSNNADKSFPSPPSSSGLYLGTHVDTTPNCGGIIGATTLIITYSIHHSQIYRVTFGSEIILNNFHMAVDAHGAPLCRGNAYIALKDVYNKKYITKMYPLEGSLEQVKIVIHSSPLYLSSLSIYINLSPMSPHQNYAIRLGSISSVILPHPQYPMCSNFQSGTLKDPSSIFTCPEGSYTGTLSKVFVFQENRELWELPEGTQGDIYFEAVNDNLPLYVEGGCESVLKGISESFLKNLGSTGSYGPQVMAFMSVTPLLGEDRVLGGVDLIVKVPKLAPLVAWMNKANRESPLKDTLVLRGVAIKVHEEEGGKISFEPFLPETYVFEGIPLEESDCEISGLEEDDFQGGEVYIRHPSFLQGMVFKVVHGNLEVTMKSTKGGQGVLRFCGEANLVPVEVALDVEKRGHDELAFIVPSGMFSKGVLKTLTIRIKTMCEAFAFSYLYSPSVSSLSFFVDPFIPPRSFFFDNGGLISPGEVYSQLAGELDTPIGIGSQKGSKIGKIFHGIDRKDKHTILSRHPSLDKETIIAICSSTIAEQIRAVYLANAPYAFLMAEEGEKRFMGVPTPVPGVYYPFGGGRGDLRALLQYAWENEVALGCQSALRCVFRVAKKEKREGMEGTEELTEPEEFQECGTYGTYGTLRMVVWDTQGRRYHSAKHNLDKTMTSVNYSANEDFAVVPLVMHLGVNVAQARGLGLYIEGVRPNEQCEQGGQIEAQPPVITSLQVLKCPVCAFYDNFMEYQVGKVISKGEYGYPVKEEGMRTCLMPSGVWYRSLVAYSEGKNGSRREVEASIGTKGGLDHGLFAWNGSGGDGGRLYVYIKYSLKMSEEEEKGKSGRARGLNIYPGMEFVFSDVWISRSCRSCRLCRSEEGSKGEMEGEDFEEGEEGGYIIGLIIYQGDKSSFIRCLGEVKWNEDKMGEEMSLGTVVYTFRKEYRGVTGIKCILVVPFGENVKEDGKGDGKEDGEEKERRGGKGGKVIPGMLSMRGISCRGLVEKVSVN